MFKNGRNLFKRQYVRLKGWLTLGSIGIMPRLIIAFASVGALAATANLIVENGVAILEHQRNAALERSALDAQRIIALRESMGRAAQAAKSAEILGAWGEFDRAAQEHADADSRASAIQYSRARSALDLALGKYLDKTGPASSQLPRLIAEHKGSADKLVSSRRVRREQLTRYSSQLTGMDMRVRTSIEQGKVSSRTREYLIEVRAQLDAVRAAFAARGSQITAQRWGRRVGGQATRRSRFVASRSEVARPSVPLPHGSVRTSSKGSSCASRRRGATRSTRSPTRRV